MEYDPEYEIIIQFLQDDGEVRIQRLKTAAGASHPKRIYFFEMLRRISDGPADVDRSELPEWFVEALEKLEKMRKDE